MSLTTITVTGSYPAGAGSSVATGYVTFVPTARIVNAAGHTIVPQLPIQVQLQLGAFTLPNVITTDNAGLSPTGWAWEITENISGVQADPYYVFIPSTYGETVDLSQLAEATPGPIVTAYANLAASNTFTEPNMFSSGLTVAGAFELDDTTIAAPPGGTTAFLRADGTWDVPAGSGGVQVAEDIGGTNDAPEVVATHLTEPLPAAQGGTGAASLSAAGLLQSANNLSDLASDSNARTNLGLGAAATLNVGTGAGTVAAGNDSRITGALQASNNLDDVASQAAARTNLGLGNSATENVGSTSGTVAAGNDSRIVGALQTSGGTMTGPIAMGSNKVTGLTNGSAGTDAAAFGQIPTSAGAIGGLLAANNLSDVANAGTARANLGLGTSATENVGTGAGTVAAGNDARITGALQESNNLGDVASAATSRTNLGLGSAAQLAAAAVAQTANNLSDLASEATARANLGLGSAALLAASAVAQTANNLADLANETTARTNLGLGTAATANLPLALASGGTGLNSTPGAISESLLATSTSTLAWSTQTYNIIAYGADPTGTADSTTAINNAITAAVAAGGTVQIPPGTYSTTGIVINGASHFCIRADRGATLWIAAPTNAAPTQATRNILTLVGCSDFAIENLTIDGRRDTIAPLTVLAANAASGQASVHVANGAATAYKAGQVLNVCGGWTVAAGAQQNLQDQGMTIASITPGTGGGNDTITFTANLANAYTAATGTQSDGYGPIAGNGGYITPWQTGTDTIAGRILTQEDQQNGIHLIGCTRFRISGCEITGMWESGIRCGDHLLNGSAQTDGATLGTITGNIIWHCYDQGIGLWCSSNMTVTGNTVTATGWAGLCMTGSDQCTITGNVSSNNAQLIPGGAGGYGVAIEGGLANVVSANQLNGNYYTPILLTALGTLPFGGPAQLATTVSSNALALPAASIVLNSLPAGWAASGQFSVMSSAGAQQITYTGVTGSTLTGCTGGVGTLYSGNRATQYPVFTNNAATLPTGSTTTIVSNGTLFQAGGHYSIVDGPRTERVTVTAINGNTLTLQYPTAFQHVDQCQFSQAVAESNQVIGNSCSGGVDAGIKLASAIRTTIDDNSLYQLGLRGIDGIIWAAGGLQAPYGTIVSNNTITAPDSSGNGAAYSAIAFAQCSDLQISGNRCGGALNATQESYVALFAQAVTGSVISKNLIADTYGVGLRLDVVDEWTCKTVTVADNMILRTGGEGIVLYGGQELQVTGNVLVGCAPNSGGGYGGALDIRGVQNSVISGNLVMDNGHGGISLDNATINGATVYTSGNTFADNISGDDGLNYDVWTNAHQQQGSGIKEVSSGQGPNTYDNNLTFGTGANFSLTSTGNTFTVSTTAFTSGQYLRGNGSTIALAAIQAADLPAGTAAAQGALQLEGTGSAIQALAASAAAGATGLAADAGHVHPNTGVVLASQLPLSLANGGTGQTGQQAAINALTGTQSAGAYLRSNGTNASLGAIQAGDLPAATPMTQGALLATQTVVGAPTGTYATDVATINAAITAAGTYGTLYFPYSATAYNVDGLAPLTGQTWYGQATLKRPTASTASVVTATGISSFTMHGLTVDGNSASSATSNAAIYLINTTWTLLQNLTVQNCPTGNAGIILRGAVRCLVDACQITNVGYGVLIGLDHGDAYSCYGNAIRGCLIDTTTNDAIFISENLGSVGSVSVVGSVIGTTVTGCTVRNFGDCGIEVGSGSVYTQVSGCSFIGISNASGNNGVLFRDAAHASATGCTVSNLTKTGSTGVYCVNLNSTCSFIDITDINIYNVGYGIIAVGGTSPTSLGTAANNICVTGGTVNVTTADGIQMTNVTGFSITGTQVYAAGNQGISVGKYNTSGSGSTDGTISGCRIMNSGQGAAGSYSGIVLFQASADIAINNCRIGDNQGASKTQGYGIRIYDSTVTNVKASNCDVTNGGTVNNFANTAAAGAGIEVYACTGISAQGLSTAVTQYAASWEPSDHGLIAWSYDAGIAALSSTQVTGGVLYLTAIEARQPFTSSKAYFSIATAGVTPTANENFIGLFNTSGTLLASKEIDTNVTGVGLQTVTWTTATSVQPAGLYWVGFFFNAATEPFLYRASTPSDNATQNVGLGTASYRMCLQAGPFTTALPSPLTVASNSISGSPRMWWVAIG